MRRLRLVIAAAMLGAPAMAAADPGCAATAITQWSAAGQSYQAEAVSTGSDCAIANVTLTIRTLAGATLLTFASAAADLPPFSRAKDEAMMRIALLRWIEQPPTRTTTRDLPGWDEGEAEPRHGAFRFHPEPAYDRIRYSELRRWGQPIFCFVQGTSATACYALDAKAGSLTLVGTLAPAR